MSFAVTCLVATFVTLTLLRVPIAYAMFSGSIVYLWVSGQDVGLVVDQTMNTLSGLYVLLAVPMFILAANVMNATTISDRLWAAADGLVGRWRGGVGHVTVDRQHHFLRHQRQRRDGRGRPRHARNAHDAGCLGLSGGLLGGPDRVGLHHRADHSSLDPDDPLRAPIGCFGRRSVPRRRRARLPDGGFADGCDRCRRTHARAAQGRSIPSRKLPRVLGRALIPMTLPVVLLGGLFSGVFTPTEAAAVAAIYAIALGALSTAISVRKA